MISLIPEIVKKLGLAYNEWFKLYNVNTCRLEPYDYMFDEEYGMVKAFGDSASCVDNDLFYYICDGSFEIVKKSL